MRWAALATVPSDVSPVELVWSLEKGASMTEKGWSIWASLQIISARKEALDTPVCPPIPTSIWCTAPPAPVAASTPRLYATKWFLSTASIRLVETELINVMQPSTRPRHKYLRSKISRWSLTKLSVLRPNHLGALLLTDWTVKNCPTLPMLLCTIKHAPPVYKLSSRSIRLINAWAQILQFLVPMDPVPRPIMSALVAPTFALSLACVS
jgi:hypothetical protein